jgi:hypothetical protein
VNTLDFVKESSKIMRPLAKISQMSGLCLLAFSFTACSQPNEAATAATSQAPAAAETHATTGAAGDAPSAADGTLSTSTREIPNAFWGKWYEERNIACNSDVGATLEVDQHDLTYPMTSAEPSDVQRVRPGTIRVTYDDHGTEEGNAVTRVTQNWTLANDNQQLTVTTEGGNNSPMVLFRCATAG